MLNGQLQRGIQEDSRDKGASRSGRFDNMRLELIDLAYQPIVNLESASMLGYEVLVRPTPESGYRNPGALITEAVQSGRARELDRLIRRKAMKAIPRLPRSQRLFLNNLPQSFAHPDFVREVLEDLAEHPNVSPEQIVLELTEWVGELRENSVDDNTLKLRENGVQIALDDVGAGINGLNQLIAVRPDWIKLDRMLISHIETDGLKQNLVRVLVRFAQLSHLRLIAEGVERREELETLIQLGVSHAQGYFLARPAAGFVNLPNDLIELIRSFRRRRESPTHLGPSVLRIEELAEPVLNLESSEHWATLRDAALADRGVTGIVVGAKHFIDRERIEPGMACPTDEDSTPMPAETGMAVEAGTLLSEALRMVAQQPREAGRPVLVHRRGKLIGVVRFASLLGSLASSREAASSHLMPLSGMPGPALADQWLHHRRRDGDEMLDLAMIDIRHFGAYNRTHGYELGDQMLLSLIELIREELVHAYDGVPLCAHLGSDRFLIACRASHQLKLRSIIDRFREGRGRHFSNIEIACNGFRGETDDPKSPVYPLSSVRVVYLSNALAHVRTCRDVQRWAEEVCAGEDEVAVRNELILFAAGPASPLRDVAAVPRRVA